MISVKLVNFSNFMITLPNSYRASLLIISLDSDGSFDNVLSLFSSSWSLYNFS